MSYQLHERHHEEEHQYPQAAYSPQANGYTQSHDYPQQPQQPHHGGYNYNPDQSKGVEYIPPPPQVHHQNHGPQKWEHGLCGCFDECGVCCTGWWCPCILFGRTRHRLHNPTMDGYSCCNGGCMGYAALCTCLPPFNFILGLMQRREIKRKYNLEGSGCGDCCKTFCCGCCALIQEENEVLSRTKKTQAMGGGYQAPGGMHYGN